MRRRQLQKPKRRSRRDRAPEVRESVSTESNTYLLQEIQKIRESERIIEKPKKERKMNPINGFKRSFERVAIKPKPKEQQMEWMFGKGFAEKTMGRK